MMRITLLCSDAAHPINVYLERWMAQVQSHVAVELVRTKRDASGGDLLFLVSCSEIITASDRAGYRTSLVLHASDLPRGRGWSPHIWELSQGAAAITLSLLEAEDKVDTGRIWRKVHIPIPRHALWDEINHLLFQAEIELIEFAIANFGTISPEPQSGEIPPTYYPRRTPGDSKVDPLRSIAEQFDLIRVCDTNRFPAYFDYLGHRYVLKIEKLNEQ
jgi:methionyl-tRNA formyltransferase